MDNRENVNKKKQLDGENILTSWLKLISLKTALVVAAPSPQSLQHNIKLNRRK